MKGVRRGKGTRGISSRRRLQIEKDGGTMGQFLAISTGLKSGCTNKQAIRRRWKRRAREKKKEEVSDPNSCSKKGVEKFKGVGRG